jgi:hypothetical protein
MSRIYVNVVILLFGITASFVMQLSRQKAFPSDLNKAVKIVNFIKGSSLNTQVS